MVSIESLLPQEKKAYYKAMAYLQDNCIPEFENICNQYPMVKQIFYRSLKWVRSGSIETTPETSSHAE